jgi:hypothetical protein
MPTLSPDDKGLRMTAPAVLSGLSSAARPPAHATGSNVSEPVNSKVAGDRQQTLLNRCRPRRNKSRQRIESQFSLWDRPSRNRPVADSSRQQTVITAGAGPSGGSRPGADGQTSQANVGGR